MRLSIEQAYRTHGPAVLRRARYILGGDEADAREVLHELFASLLERPEQYSGDGSLMAFLYRATTNLCLNRLRNKRTRARLLQERGAPPPFAPARAEARTLVRDLLERLPREQAVAAVHYYVDGMSQAEIATLLGCSRRHVGNLLARVVQGFLKIDEERRP